MNKYSIERVKKESELQSLNYFVAAYENVTGESLNIAEVSERPDFICEREKGIRVGVELSKVRRNHPNDILWDNLVEKQLYMSREDALKIINNSVLAKEKKRKEPGWQISESTILIIELADIPLTTMRHFIKPAILPDIYETGFQEIWFADFTGIEAYDNVELFCVKPDALAGYYPRSLQKPYG